MVILRRGDIWWRDEPTSNRRPYLLMTRDEAIPVLTRVVAVPLTTTIRGIPSELRLGPDDGMPEECVATFDNVATVAKTSLVARITTLPSERMADACDALRAATDC